MRTFTVGWLYPDLMNIYGDRGNVLTLLRRASWRGMEARLVELGRGQTEGLAEVDVFFFGGGQDKEQVLVYRDLRQEKEEGLRARLGEGAMMLAVCGGYQLLGESYTTAEGERLPGLGLIDAVTEAGRGRRVGNVVVQLAAGLGLRPGSLVGFENHGGRTRLGPAASPLGRVLAGSGNNGDDGGEGALQGNVVGTYLHGSLLPKNPHLADWITARALGEELQPLDDELELEAHRVMVERTISAASDRARRPNA